MKKYVDNFSAQAKIYKKYRPTYPDALYQTILSHVESRQQCWDCGTGNGQVAAVMAQHFEQVIATDISQNQLDQAEKRNNILYKKERAERTSFENDQFDLITCAQAIHWFDLQVFQREVRRVAKHGAIIAIWGYGLIKIEENLDRIITEFDSETVGPFWNVERKHIDTGYQSIPFDFDKIALTRSFSIEAHWTIQQLQGYFDSWSCVQNYTQQLGYSPVPAFMKKIKAYWKPGMVLPIKFPIFIKIGRIVK